MEIILLPNFPPAQENIIYGFPRPCPEPGTFSNPQLAGVDPGLSGMGKMTTSNDVNTLDRWQLQFC